LLQQVLPAIEGLHALRAISPALLGLQTYLRAVGGDRAVRRMRVMLAERLLDAFRHAGSDRSWPWPEDRLTYANARLPHALIDAGAGLDSREMLETGLSTLSWLVEVQTADGHFAPVGNRGWFPRKGEKALFDQQPIEAEATIAACIAAHDATGEQRWLDEANRAFRWFLGDNDLGEPLYDHASGGCCDGLGPTEINRNQGAESTLCWLSALVQLHELQARGKMGWTREAWVADRGSAGEGARAKANL
jgi:hypothetical protein